MESDATSFRGVQDEGQSVSEEPKDSVSGARAKRPSRPMRLKKRRRKLDLRKTLFVLPNAITMAAVFCGFNAIRTVAAPGATTDDFYRAAFLLILSMVFDLVDGRVARLTKTQSAFGLQIDSLADVISFGVAPALLVYQWVLHRLGLLGLLGSFVYVACAAIRLARFNVLTTTETGAPVKPGKYIIGLPSPPASGVLISLVVANHAMDGALGDPRYTVAILLMTVVIGFFMVSTIRFRSFKDLRLNTGTILFVLFVIVSSAFVWQRIAPQFVLVWLLSFYLLVGVIESTSELIIRATTGKKREAREVP